MEMATGMATGRRRTPATADSREYFDVLLLGKTGMGKSTTGNKILYQGDLQADNTEFTVWSLCGRRARQVNLPENEQPHSSEFKESPEDSVASTSDGCELYSNDDAKLRILDTPGFQSSDALGQNIPPPTKQTWGLCARYCVFKHNIALYLTESSTFCL